MSRRIAPEPLDPAAFAPFGDVLEAAGAPDRIINAGLCGRFHDRARLDFGPEGRAGNSIFRAALRRLPLRQWRMIVGGPRRASHSPATACRHQWHVPRQCRRSGQLRPQCLRCLRWQTTPNGNR